MTTLPSMSIFKLNETGGGKFLPTDAKVWREDVTKRL